MKIRSSVFIIILLLSVNFVCAQVNSYASRNKSLSKKGATLAENYGDSLTIFKHKLDSLSTIQNEKFPINSYNISRLFLPLTFYRDVINNAFSLDENTESFSNRELNNLLIKIYLARPDLVLEKSTKLTRVGSIIQNDGPVTNKSPEIVEKIAPVAVEPDIIPLDIVVKKPNFWTFAGDYFLQFLQNYISGNWYKGGESNFSTVGSAVLQANFNNKQKVKWDNKLELKLGYQTSRGDTLHNYKTSEDLIRYTSKLGLQATKNWYYSFQMIANTQFTHSYKSNDPKIYSDFLSPLNLNFSVGMDYNANWFKKRLTGTIHLAPFAYNFKYVKRLELSERYGLDNGKHSLNDFGSEFDIDFVWKLSDNIKWNTRLYGYTTYKRAELEWENTISFQFNKYISTNIFVYPRFDDGSKRDEQLGFWQFKEYASVGFSYSF